ncbi:MAG: phosphoglycerate dehydrogenase [Candidatus Omnitrophica bacterium]|nr:phosphoglycerate dehydrogenase [Candidatus Omnitrophota bacterium]
MVKILICDELAEEGLGLFRQEKNLSVVLKTKLPLEELKKQIADADACIVRSGTQLTADVIGAARKLKVIGRAGVGLDNVDVEAASKKGIIVMNTPGGNTISAAEHTFSLLMALARNIPQASVSVKKGEWERKKFTGVELYEKTLGILGLGRIGTEVARRAQAFGMRVIGYDPFLRAEKALEIGVEAVSLDELLKQSDFLTLHMPLTAENRHLIGAKELEKMKKTARVINCARGGLVDEAALAEAIKNGRLAGAALDVFETEPPGDGAIVGLPQVIVTPHLGASTEEAQIAVAVDVVQSVIDFFKGKSIRNAVNFPSVDPEVLEQIKPYIHLAEKMGSLLAQLIEGQILQVDIEYHGQAVGYEATPITVAAIKGLLAPILAESVNYVNASFLAKERGIKITEAKTSDASRYSNLIDLDVRTDKKTSKISGTVFTREDTRVVRLDGFDVEVAPEGYLLLISNRDVPGIVGQIGTLLGAGGVNIAGMTLGRDKPGGQARTLLKIDSAVPDAVMHQIKKAKNVLDAKLIRL